MASVYLNWLFIVVVTERKVSTKLLEVCDCKSKVRPAVLLSNTTGLLGSIDGNFRSSVNTPVTLFGTGTLF